MRQSQWIAAFALAATLAGCGRAPATPIYRIQTNIGIQGVMPGDEAGYFITANVGATYRLVWTGDVNQTAVFRNFHGAVYTSGRILSVTPGCDRDTCPLESGDNISVVTTFSGGQRVDSDTVTADSLDGFDFSVDTEPVMFDLYIDGGRYPSNVYFPAADNGGQVSSPSQFPFGLSTI